jgi:hypothetical protein
MPQRTKRAGSDEPLHVERISRTSYMYSIVTPVIQDATTVSSDTPHTYQRLSSTYFFFLAAAFCQSPPPPATQHARTHARTHARRRTVRMRPPSGYRTVSNKALRSESRYRSALLLEKNREEPLCNKARSRSRYKTRGERRHGTQVPADGQEAGVGCMRGSQSSVGDTDLGGRLCLLLGRRFLGRRLLLGGALRAARSKGGKGSQGIPTVAGTHHKRIKSDIRCVPSSQSPAHTRS